MIHSVDPRKGGPIEGVKQFGAALSWQGVRVEVVSLDAPGSDWVREFPLPLHTLGSFPIVYGYSPALVPWLRRHAGEYDIVVVNGVWQYHGFAVWRALRGAKVPYFVFPHGMLDPWFQHHYPLKHLKKKLYWWAVERRVLRDAAAVLFTAEEERRKASISFSPYACNEVVVNYGTSGPKGDPAKQREAFFEAFPQLRSKRLILFLGRIHVKKGCDMLIDAFARVGMDACLVMAGPEAVPYGAELRQQAERLGVADRVVWTGMLSGDLKWGAFRASEAFVLPSHQENFGVAVAEALACGLPVLISNKVDIWREIEAAGAGLIAPDTVEGVEGLLRRWLALDLSARQRMGENARRCFTGNYEIAAAARRLLEVYRSR